MINAHRTENGLEELLHYVVAKLGRAGVAIIEEGAIYADVHPGTVI